MRLSRVFDSCQSQGRAAAVAFTVAGYPTQDATIEVLLTMQRGGIGQSGYTTSPSMRRVD